MADEFWRELKPVAEVFRPGAVPEQYIHDAATYDERWYAPLSPTVGTRPLYISPTQNRWCDILFASAAGLVNRHYHPQQVFAAFLPPTTPGISPHDLRQVGLPGARLGGD